MATSDAATVCLNIGAPERRQRLLFGVVELVFTAVLLAVFIGTDQPRLLRLVLFVPWAMGAVGIFQAKESTCVALAARGMREVDGVKEPLPPSQADGIKQRARKVYLQSLGAAVLLTAVSLAL